MPSDNSQPKAVVEITLADVYATLLDVRDKVASLATSRENTDAAVKDHESRLRALERRVWAIPSLAAVVATVSLVVALTGGHPLA